MINKDLSKPLYEQIRDYLLSKIQDGAYPPSTKLPSERQLAEDFGVSRLTVSKAIEELVKIGWLYVQIGKGTYVNDHPIDQQITTLTSFTEEMQRRGKPVYSRVLRAELLPAPPEIAVELQIPPVMHIALLERIRYVNQQPVAIEEAYFIASRCHTIFDQHDFSQSSLYAVLAESYGINLTYAEQTFEARAANRVEASRLEVKKGAPVLAIHRVAYTQEDQPFEVVNSIYRGDRYKFRAVLRRR